MKRSLAAVILFASIVSAHADGFGSYGFAQSTLHAIAPPPPVGTAPVSTAISQIVGLDYPNNGTSVGLTGNATTLTADNGVWANSPLSYAYNWHTVAAPGTSLGTGPTLTISGISSSPLLGQAIELDVTAANLAGSATQTSHWFGPIETTTPVAPLAWELQGALPTQLSPPPVNFLENGHAMIPGCLIPPAVPPNTASGNAHVWYFDPVGGTTQDAGATGHTKATAFNSIQALFNAGVSGYSGGALFARTIAAGDTIYLEAGTAAQYGQLIVSGTPYSTTNGLIGGTVAWTWVMADPLATGVPVVSNFYFSGGGGYFIFKNFNAESYRNSDVVRIGGNSVNPIQDVMYENIGVSQWLTHSTDPWLPSNYPTTGGTSDGTVLTASPTETAAGPQDSPPTTLTANVSIHATTLPINQVPPMSYYVWAPGYYYQGIVASTVTGIANGSIVVAINGLDAAHYVNTNASISVPNNTPPTVTTFAATDLTGLAQSGSSPTTSTLLLPQTRDLTHYWVVKAGATTQNPAVYTWNIDNSTIFIPIQPTIGDTLTINGTVWTYIANGATPVGNQIALGAGTNPLAATMGATGVALNASSDTNTHASTYTNSGNTLFITYRTAGADLSFSCSITGGTCLAYAWTSPGTILPVPWTTDQAVFLTNPLVVAGNFLIGQTYVITAIGTTNFTAICSGCAGTLGSTFTATGRGAGTGNAVIASTRNHIQHYTTSSGAWTDLGTPTVTIAACDPVLDAATGCPASYPPGGITTNIPGCDPIISLGPTGTRSGGCPGGVPVDWNGTSAAMTSGGVLQYTPVMTILPANYWNSTDWDGQSSDGFKFSGGITGGINPAQPNIVQGCSCISVKDSSFREGSYAFGLVSAHDIMIYNNKIKWLSGDAFDVYGDNRVWILSNYYSDPTLIWAHQDGIQYGTANGLQATNWVQNYAVDNEFYEWTDQTNYFPRTMQGISVTDDIGYGMYVGQNIVFARTGSNNIAINGPWNTVVNNVGIGTLVSGGNQAKAGFTTPLFDLLANNVGNGVTRDSRAEIPNGCNVSTGDQSTVETNLSLPFINPTASTSSVYCFTGATAGYASNSAAGVFVGQSAWTATDWQNPSGTYPLFTAYHPVGPPTAGQPGFGIASSSAFISPCTQGWFPWTGSCAPGSNGIANLRPLSSYTGTSPTVVANVLATGGIPVDLAHFPSTGSPGDQAVLGVTTPCSNSTGTVCLSSPNAYANLSIVQGLYTRGTTNFGTMSDWGAVAGFTLNSSAANFGPSCTGSAAVAITGDTTITCPSANILSWSPTQITGIIVGPHEPALTPFNNVTVTTNVGATINSASMTSTANSIISSGAAPFGPGLKAQGTALGSSAMPADHDGKAWGSPPSIGAYQ